jgi:hypothetical protein
VVYDLRGFFFALINFLVNTQQYWSAILSGGAYGQVLHAFEIASRYWTSGICPPDSGITRQSHVRVYNSVCTLSLLLWQIPSQPLNLRLPQTDVITAQQKRGCATNRASGMTVMIAIGISMSALGD